MDAFMLRVNKKGESKQSLYSKWTDFEDAKSTCSVYTRSGVGESYFLK